MMVSVSTNLLHDLGGHVFCEKKMLFVTGRKSNCRREEEHACVMQSCMWRLTGKMKDYVMPWER